MPTISSSDNSNSIIPHDIKLLLEIANLLLLNDRLQHLDGNLFATIEAFVNFGSLSRAQSINEPQFGTIDRPIAHVLQFPSRFQFLFRVGGIYAHVPWYVGKDWIGFGIGLDAHGTRIESRRSLLLRTFGE
jgi:hypothetical protein